MRWQGREGSSNIEDRRGSSGGGGGRGFGGLAGIIVVLVGAYFGVDLSGLVANDSGLSLGSQQQQAAPLQESAQEKQLVQFSSVVLRDTEKVWEAYFRKIGRQYQAPKLTLYRNRIATACGTGQSSAGPFYCPGDQKLYIDLSFYNTMTNELGASGDAAFAYVLAHEVGHHVQTLLGNIQKVHRAQQNMDQKQANQLSVRLELQADCYAGVWAHYAEKDGLFESGDIEEAFNAAHAVGDDHLQERAQGYTVPHTYTHGTSAQRKQWLQRGLQTGDIEQCNTFSSM